MLSVGHYANNMKQGTALLGLLALGCGREIATPPAPGSSESGRVALHGTKRFGDVGVTPLEIAEDSRCPRCVHVGTVRVLAWVVTPQSQRRTMFTMDQPIQVAPKRWLMLSGVCPAPKAEMSIPPEAYRLIVGFGVDGPPPPLDFSCPD